MNKIKKILMAVFIAGFMGLVSGYSTVAVAAEDEAGVQKGIDDTIMHVKTAMEAAQKNNKDMAMEHIQLARQTAKEITGDDKGMLIQRANSRVRKARAMVKHGDLTGAGHKLGEALKIYEDM